MSVILLFCQLIFDMNISAHGNCNTGARGTDLPLPLFSNFLFTNLFSITFLYFFIISSLFPYFNLFVSIFIQSYVNIKLHVSTLYSNSYNLMLTSNCMCRPYIDTRTLFTLSVFRSIAIASRSISMFTPKKDRSQSV